MLALYVLSMYMSSTQLTALIDASENARQNYQVDYSIG